MDCTEQNERHEIALAESGAWFRDLSKPQLARYNDRMAVNSAYRGAPRWDREREAAWREFTETTTDAAAVCNAVYRDMLATGEVSEETNEAFNNALIAPAMLEAAE